MRDKDGHRTLAERIADAFRRAGRVRRSGEAGDATSPNKRAQEQAGGE
ncbi:hypothetical protein IAG44_41090 [Streptomyces roseirectus]|uniref:Uncharacterized protein n=1 Tax=Streptomyces roseirectus TaxID=2768066 RepID=A0A7H0IQW2_9ACTN|nr:hypothetical protein [Streptomyces roseirectus]QNP75178.1 hypothetical protein IAG44_41090 [Streptomyces roseirectus]